MCIVIYTNPNAQVLNKEVVSVFCGAVGDPVTIDDSKYYINDVITENYYQFKCSIVTVVLSPTE